MGRPKKLLSDIRSNISASAIWDGFKWLFGILWENRKIIFSAISTWLFSWVGKIIGWFSNMNTAYTVLVYCAFFLASLFLLSSIPKAVNRITKKESPLLKTNKASSEFMSYKSLGFHQHWYQPNLIEIAHGDQKKGVGIRVNNNGNKSILSFRVEMRRLYYKKSLSEEFKEISIETHPFWWDLGNSHTVNLEELDVDRHAFLMFARPVSAFPHFVFMTSAVPPDSNYSGVPRHDGYYKVFLQFSGFLKNSENKMKPILFRAEFKYENLEFSEFKGQGYAKEK